MRITNEGFIRFKELVEANESYFHSPLFYANIGQNDGPYINK